MGGDYLFLSGLWVGWCVIHSIFASDSVTGYLQKRMGMIYHFYRLLYNLFAAVSLVVPLSFGAYFQLFETSVFIWDGWYACLRWTMILVALIVFIAGARDYDLSYFLGLSQVRRASTIQRGDILRTNGILAIIRHPWYAGGILVVWSGMREIYLSTLITATILTLYLLVGTILEERKLVALYGDSYRDYQRRVSMLFPRRWLVQTFKKK